MGLVLKDPDAFLASYQHMGTSESCTMLRINYYNRLDDRHIKTGQIRCGEHTDYMGITLLFQDQIGGLEVCVVICVYTCTVYCIELDIIGNLHRLIAA